MKIIAIGAVTAGGKTTVVNELAKKIPRTAVLHFDDYSFEGEVEDFGKWLSEGADPDVWDLSPLKADIERIKDSGEYDCLLLDYPFAYRHSMIKDALDCCIFIDTPLDIALARRVLRDMGAASADEIRSGLSGYLKYERPAYIHMLKVIKPDSDHVIDGSGELKAVVDEAAHIIAGCRYRIRPIEPADNKTVETIIRGCLTEFGAAHEGTAWADPFLGRLSEVYSAENSCYWVAVDEDGEIVGGVGIGDLAGAEDICELQKMYCLPKARGTGVSHLLMDTALAFAAEHYSRCYLETLENMTAAQRFYEKYGFVRICEPLAETAHFACDVRYVRELCGSGKEDRK